MNHLTETEIQDCALGTAGLDQIEHLSSCPLCDSEVANYRVILATMDELPQPQLDFDVTELVISRLPQPPVTSPTPGERWVYVIACFVLALLFAPLYLYRNDLLKMTRDVQPMALCLVGLTALVILVFHVREMYREHLKKLNALISGDLQL